MPEVAGRFYLDNDVPLRLGDELRRAGHDAIHVRDLGTFRRSDADHLLAATRDGRIVVTHNRKDYLLLHDAWHRWTLAWTVLDQHAGVLCLPHNLQPHALFVAIDVFLSSDFPIANEVYTYSPATSWIRQPYQP